MPPTAGSSTGSAGPRFYFDLASPTSWLVAERVLRVMPVATEWVPVHLADGPVEGEAFRCATEADIYRQEIERRARALELQPVRWPDPFPFDSGFAMRAATFAKSTGRAVPFALAAFRQAYCGGRALDDPDVVLVAAAACELHPAAVLKGAGLTSTAERLRRASAGVATVPVVIGPDGERFAGEDAPERAAAALVS